MKKVKTLALLLILGCAPLSVSAQRVINLNDEKAGISLQKRARGTDANVELKEDYPGQIKAYRPLVVNPALKSPETVAVGDTIILELFEDKVYKAVVSRTETALDGLFGVTLKVLSDNADRGYIVTDTEGKSLVSVKNFGIRTPSDGRVYLIEVDNTNAPRMLEGAHAEIPKDIPENSHIGIDGSVSEQAIGAEKNPQKKKFAPAAAPAINCGPVAKENPNDPATIDLLILYTPDVEAFGNIQGGITLLIDNMVNNANIPFNNSQTNITLRRVRSERVDYTEPVPYNMSTTLNRLQNPGDGFMDEIHALRGAPFNADLVQLITMENEANGIPASGISYTLNQETGRCDYAFSVVNVKVLDTSINNSYLTSVHEWGHNIGGLGHAAQQTTGIAQGLFDYSYGYRFQGSPLLGSRYYATVMAYPDGIYYGDTNNATKIPYFSNPDVMYQLALTGAPLIANAAQSLREMKHVIAYYSDRVANFSAVPTDVTVSAETDNGATFKWNAATNATLYRVYIKIDEEWHSWSITSNPTSTTMIVSDPDISSGTTYEYYIRAFNDCNDYVNSPTQTFTTTGTRTNLEDNPAKEIQSTDCYTVTGIKTDCNSDTPGVVFKRTSFTDGSTQVVKELR